MSHSRRQLLTTLVAAACLAAGGTACSGTDNDDDAADAIDVQDAYDAEDSSDGTTDDVDLDAPVDDADDAPDAADVPDIEDTPDTADGEDTEDAPDGDAAEVPDTPDVPIDATDADVDADGGDGGDTDVEEDTSGCVPSEDPPDDTPFFIEIGVGEDSVTTANCTETLLAQGFQGGFHVWGAARGVGLSTAEPELDVTARNADGELVAAVYYTFPWDLVGGERQITGITVFLDVDVRPDDVDGEVWELCATANDGEATASDCMEIVVRCCDYLD